jgi:hypothetical protein
LATFPSLFIAFHTLCDSTTILLNGKLQLQDVQREREEKLAEILKNRLHLYVQGNKEEFVRLAEAEVSRLSDAGLLSSVFNSGSFSFTPVPALPVAVRI